MPIVFKSGSLNLLELYGPVQACNGIDLPFLLQYVSTNCFCSLREFISNTSSIPDSVHRETNYYTSCFLPPFLPTSASLRYATFRCTTLSQVRSKIRIKIGSSILLFRGTFPDYVMVCSATCDSRQQHRSESSSLLHVEMWYGHYLVRF